MKMHHLDSKLFLKTMIKKESLETKKAIPKGIAFFYGVK